MSPISEKGRITRTIGGIATAALIAFATLPAHAQKSAPGPFASFIGSWSGTGSVTLADGTKERLRCKVSYSLDNSNETLSQNMRCASDSYKFDLKAEAREKGGTVSGRWTEVTRNASGLLSGRVSGGQIQASVRHPGFTAELTLATRGDNQSITIVSAGNQPVTVSITLNRTQ